MFGEDSTSPFVADALHWVLVYSELIQFASTMLLASELASEGLSFAARVNAEVERTVLRTHADGYRRRCAFWYERASDLSASALANN